MSGAQSSEASRRADDAVNTYLAAVPALDWNDLERVHDITAPVLKALAADRPALRALVERIHERPDLLAMCERHYLLDYFVLHDAPERDFRLRIHLHTDNHKERPHNHRFPFTTYVMRGSYVQLIQRVRDGLRESTVFEDMDVAYSTTERAGSCYTISPHAVHTTYTEPDSVSLVIRGPAALTKSIIVDRETRSVTWRYGRQDETPERRAKVEMSRDDFASLVGKLERLEII